MKKQATKEDKVTTTAERLREEARECDEKAAESFDRCDTDGFLSQWAHGITAQQKRRQADIEEAGGIATFFRDKLVRLDGEEENAKLINGRYGQCWAICDEQGEFTGQFISAFPKRAATMERKGYVEEREFFTAEAVADTAGSGRGLSGACSVHVIVRPKDYAVKYDGCEGLGDLTK